MRKFLVPLSGQYDLDNPASFDRPALTAAFTLARRLGSHVEAFCIDAEVAHTRGQLAPWVPGSAVDLVLQSIEQESDNRRRRARALFAELVAAFGEPPYASRGAGTGFSVDLVEATSPVEAAVAQRGRIADLIVAGHPAGGDIDRLPPILRQALTETGRPVLVPGRGAVPDAIGSRILIAWDGGESVARTVALTRDLLARADAVSVVSVQGDDEIRPSPEELADYLDWHGVDAEPHVYRRDDRPPGELLLDAAAARQADLILLGASLRGSLRRLVTGDVLDDLLRDSELPLLMAQ